MSHSLETSPSSRLERYWWLVPLALAALMNWGHRNEFKPDAIAYVESGSHWWAGEWEQAVTGYWNPLFPIAISSIARFAPAPDWEPLLLHFTNFLLFGALLFSFAKLMRELQRDFLGSSDDPVARTLHPALAYIALGVSLWVLFLLKLQYVEADTFLGIWVVWSFIFLLRIRRGAGGMRSYAGLGVALALGYLTKSVIFILAPIFLICAMLCARGQERWRGTLLAAALYGMLIAPNILMLSSAKGRWTFSDSGKLSYAWEVNGVGDYYYFHWQGSPKGSGQPLRTTRRILENPPAFEFDRGRPGSYPLWYDASYWYEGLRTQFSPRRQMARMAKSAIFLMELLLRSAASGIVFSTLLLLWLAAGRPRSLWPTRRSTVLWLPTLACVVIYSLVYLESRYIAVFLGVSVAGAFAYLTQGAACAAHLQKMLPLRGFALAMLIVVSLICCGSAFKAQFSPAPFSVLIHQNVADQLRELGVNPGGKIAVIGSGLDDYYARLARVQIVGEVPTTQGWEHSDANYRRIIEAVTAETSCQAIVAESLPRSAGEFADWITMDFPPHYSIYLIQR